VIEFYGQYRVFIISALNIAALFLSIYFFINSKEKIWFKYYSKGFFLIFLGGILLLINLFMSLPRFIVFARKFITISLSCYGFYIVIRGWKIEKNITAGSTPDRQ